MLYQGTMIIILSIASKFLYVSWNDKAVLLLVAREFGDRTFRTVKSDKHQPTQYYITYSQ